MPASRVLLCLSTATLALATAAVAQTSSVTPTPQNPDTTPPAPTGATAPQPQAAPAAPSDASDSTVSDIVVTAQRRSQSLQKVPITVDAVSSDQIEKNGITNTLEIQQLVPGLVMNKQFAGANPFLRGVGSVSAGLGAEMSVATYVDGFYVPTPAGGLFSLNNVERVEVLKGPQGTLFGRNASGGVIQVITRDPSQETHVDASAGYSNYDTVNLNFYGTTGIADDLAVGLASTYQHQGDGWGTNLYTGKDAFYDNDFGVQGKLKWTPGSDTKVTLSGFYDNVRTDIGDTLGIPKGEFGQDGTPYLGRYTVDHIPSYTRTRQYMADMRIEQDLGFANLVSLTGYNHLHTDFQFSQNAIIGRVVPSENAVNIFSYGSDNTFTQELQLLSPSSSRVQWIVGAFYLNEVTRNYQGLYGTCDDTACSGPTPQLTYGKQNANSIAGFAQATFPIFEGTRLTTGIRYTRDHKELSGAVTPLAGYPNSVTTLAPSVVQHPGDPAPGFPDGIDPSHTWPKLTWRASLDHDFSDTILGYLSYNRGFKSGVYNIASFGNPPAAPEQLDAYEGGLKTQLFGRHLRLNMSGFYYDFNDIQLRTSSPPAPPGQAILYNAARARIYGADLDFELRATHNLSFSGGFEALNGKYTSFPGRTCTGLKTIGGTVLGGTMVVTCPSGDATLIRAPHFTGELGFDYTVPSSIGNFVLSAKDTYTSKQYFDPSNRLYQKAYNYANVTLTWTNPSGRYDIQGFVRNLTNAFYTTVELENVGGNDVYAPGDPRTYGIRVGMHF